LDTVASLPMEWYNVISSAELTTLIYSFSFSSITHIDMTDKIPTPPPHPEPRPPWMLTPPPSAEKLVRALLIDPPNKIHNISSRSTVEPFYTLVYEPRAKYLAYLEHIISPSYRDPPFPSSRPRQEPLFLVDQDDDDIQIGSDNRMASLWSCTYADL
jgi:hypothetical protein